MIISFVVNLLLTALLSVLFVRGSDASVTATSPLITLLSSVGGIFLAPLMPIASTLLYYDARVRSEGLDIALRSTPGATPADVTPPALGFSFNSQDVVNLVLITFGTFGAMLGLGLLYLALLPGLVGA